MTKILTQLVVLFILDTNIDLDTKKFDEEFIFVFQNKAENFNIPKGGKIALTNFSKLIAVITNKRYNRLEKIKNTLKVDA